MAYIAIVGAGVAGLAAGRALVGAGHEVTIFEKSRGPGGRLATRRVEGYRFDHGAQYFKAPDLALQELVEATGQAIDIGRPVWIFDGAGQIAEGDPILNADPKWTWPSGNNALAKYLARGLDLRLEATIDALRDNGRRISLVDENDQSVGDFDAALLTPPAPQSAAIISASQIAADLRERLLDELGQASYRRCISISFAYPRRPAPPWYAVVNVDRQHAISWLACEHDKPGRIPASMGLITAQMSHAWSMKHWELLRRGSYVWDATTPGPLIEASWLALTLIGQEPGPPLWANVQRWRYALPDSSCRFEVLNGTGSRLYFAGDFVCELGRVHLAIQSGERVAAQMLRDL